MANWGSVFIVNRSRLGDWADDLAREDTAKEVAASGNAAQAQAFQQVVNSGQTGRSASSPATGGSMWASLFGNLLSQGSASAGTFNNSINALYAADVERAKARQQTLLLGGAAVVGVGFLAWYLNRK